MEWKGPEEKMKAENMILPCSRDASTLIIDSVQPEEIEFLG